MSSLTYFPYSSLTCSFNFLGSWMKPAALCKSVLKRLTKACLSWTCKGKSRQLWAWSTLTQTRWCDVEYFIFVPYDREAGLISSTSMLWKEICLLGYVNEIKGNETGGSDDKVSTPSLVVTHCAGDKRCQLWEAISQEPKGFRNFRNYRRKKHKFLSKIGLVWAPFPQTYCLACARRQSEYYEFFFSKSAHHR